MNRLCTRGLIAALVTLGGVSASHAASVTVDPSAGWLGYMNVSELPANGGAYLWGSGWGTQDLTATWSGPVLKLGPNTIGDPADYWYVGGGAPGSPGNKLMEANMYVEAPAGTLNGESVTFSGTVLSNSLTSAHTAVAFIKDFAFDYSSVVMTTVPLTPGDFSVTLDTIADPGRHVQYGFQMVGVNVWATDVAPFGDVQITAIVPEPATLSALSLAGLALVRRKR